MIWLDMRCERREDDISGCWSHSNAGPFESSCSETNKAVIDAYASLKKLATSSGWMNIKGEGWVCPSCLKTQ